MTAPRADQLEVSLFGPGYGESVLVHLGEGDWLVADSCFDQRARSHPVLQYLERINVDPSRQVRSIVVSHWHADHVRGLGQLVENCESAKIFISAALKSEELAEITMSSGANLSAQSPLRELRRVADLLLARSNRTSTPPLELAIAGRVLHRRGGSIRCSVEAVAPSSADVIATKVELSKLATVMWDAPRVHPNDASVALWVEFGDLRLLLGADLERKRAPDRGWKAVVAHHASSLAGLASVIKVPHHGSITGHEDDMWRTMAEVHPHALIAPFRPSKLPTGRDLARLRGLTDRIHLTAKVNTPKAPTPPRAIAGLVKDVREPEGRAGQIRIRGFVGDKAEDLSVEYFHPAHSV